MSVTLENVKYLARILSKKLLMKSCQTPVDPVGPQ